MRLDIGPRCIDQRGIIHAGRAGGLAAEARETAVEMLHRLRGGRRIALKHMLHQYDAPARAVPLVAQNQIGRTGRGAEAAMHASAQRLFRLLHMRIGQLFRAECRAHQMPSNMRPGFNTCLPSNAALTARVSVARAGASGSNTASRALTASAARIKVACPPNCLVIPPNRSAVSSLADASSHSNPPAQSAYQRCAPASCTAA